MLQTGLSPNQTNSYGETPADLVVYYFWNNTQQQATLDLCSDLLNDGGYMTHHALDWRHQPNVLNPAYHLSRCDLRWNNTLWRDYTVPLLWSLCDRDELQDINLPKELQPLIFRSRSLLLSLLKNGSDFQVWVSSYTQWPPGLSLLLEYGYTPTEECVVRACEADCEESLKFLIGTRGLAIGPSVLEVAAKQHSPAISELVVQALADRRRKLQALADNYLTNELSSRPAVRSDCLLDTEAYDIYQLLKKKIGGIDDLEMQYGWAVYEHIGANLKLADLLWNIGFRNVDGENRYLKTPLMNLWSTSPPCSLNTFLMKANWFITKGADLNRQKTGSSITALHYLSHDVGNILHFMESTARVASELHQLSAESADLIRKILVEEICDDCCCPYSLDGCTGLTRLLDGLFRPWPNRCVKTPLPILEVVLEAIMPLLEPVSQERLYPRLLRYIACQELEITHTCVHGDYKDREICLEEIYEIHDEEKELLSELEQLLEEFIKLGTTSNCPGSFTAWWIQINNALSVRNALSEEEISRIVEVGVIFQR
ncbi:hypothetical protein BJX64DRAFT_259906 [Aspergillus heterothallicus]